MATASATSLSNVLFSTSKSLSPLPHTQTTFSQCTTTRRRHMQATGGTVVRCMAVAAGSETRKKSGYEIQTLTNWILKQEQAGIIDAELTIVLSRISMACKQIASLVQRASISNLTGVQGAVNIQGEDQKKLDVVSNEVSDLDRKVRRGRERLDQEVEIPPPPPISAEKSEQLSVLEDKIKILLEQVESLGEEGKIDEAAALMRKVEILNLEKALLTKQPQQDKLLMVAQKKKMALCEICGSFLIANDAAERTQSHVTGKQHMGYGLVREFLAEYKEAKEKAREEERLAREKEAEERRKLRETENDSRRRSGSTDRDRNRGRDYGMERDRYRGRDCDETSRDRYGRGNRGSDIRSRNGRDGSRDRYRERDRSRSPMKYGNSRSSRSPVRSH